MKKSLILLAAVWILSGPLAAQTHLFLEEQEVNLPDGKVTAWVLPVSRDLDEVLNDFKDYCKDRSDLKMKKGDDNMLIAEKVSVPIITTLRGDMIGYGFITEEYYGLAIIFKVGYDLALTSKEWESEMQNLHNYARSFMSYHYEQSYARKIEALDKEIKDLEKERKQTENKIDNLTDKINSLGKKIGNEEDSAKISEYEAEINTLESDMSLLMDTLPGMESKLAELNTLVNKYKSESYSYQSTIGGL